MILPILIVLLYVACCAHALVLRTYLSLRTFSVRILVMCTFVSYTYCIRSQAFRTCLLRTFAYVLVSYEYWRYDLRSVTNHTIASSSFFVDPPDVSSGAEGFGNVATSGATEAGNRGWADVMSRLLNAPAPNKKYVILSKAKKALPNDEAGEEVEEESDPGFEVDGAEAKPVEKKKRKMAVRSRAVKRKEDVEKRKKVGMVIDCF